MPAPRIAPGLVAPRGYVPENPDAYLTFDFTRQRYRLNGVSARAFNATAIAGLSVSRAGTAYAQTAAGLLVPFSSNVARITDKGLLVEESRTKKNTNRNVNPQSTSGVSTGGDAAAVLSVVDDSAKLAAIGLSGNVYKLDNTAGVAAAFAIFSGTTGNTNKHSISTYMRGTGVGRPRLTSGVGASLNVALSGSYVQAKNENLTPAATTAQGLVEVDAGGVVYFTLTTLEEGAFCTSPIYDATGGSTATRPADSVSVGGLSGLTAIATILAQATAPNASSSFSRVADLNDGSDNSNNLWVGRNGVSARAFAFSGGVQQFNPTLATWNNGASGKVAAAQNAGAYTAAFNAGAVSSASGSAPVTQNRLSIGCAAAGGGAWNDYIQKVVVYPSVPGVQALTA